MTFNIEVLEDLLSDLWKTRLSSGETNKVLDDRIEAIVDILNYLQNEGEFN